MSAVTPELENLLRIQSQWATCRHPLLNRKRSEILDVIAVLEKQAEGNTQAAFYPDYCFMLGILYLEYSAVVSKEMAEQYEEKARRCFEKGCLEWEPSEAIFSDEESLKQAVQEQEIKRLLYLAYQSVNKGPEWEKARGRAFYFLGYFYGECREEDNFCFSPTLGEFFYTKAKEAGYDMSLASFEAKQNKTYSSYQDKISELYDRITSGKCTEAEAIKKLHILLPDLVLFEQLYNTESDQNLMKGLLLYLTLVRSKKTETEADQSKAKYCFDMMAEALKWSIETSLYYCAGIFKAQQRYESAFAFSCVLADMADPSGYYNLGVAYKEGQGVQSDLQQALSYFEEAAKSADFKENAEKQIGEVRQEIEELKQETEKFGRELNSWVKGLLQWMTDSRPPVPVRAENEGATPPRPRSPGR